MTRARVATVAAFAQLVVAAAHEGSSQPRVSRPPGRSRCARVGHAPSTPSATPRAIAMRMRSDATVPAGIEVGEWR